MIYDVSNPSFPVRRGRLAPTSQPVYPTGGGGSITIPFVQCALGPGGYLMAISSMDDGNNNMYGRLSTIDVSNPDNPQEVAYFNTGTDYAHDFGPTGLAARSSRVFMTEFSWNTSSRLQVVDVNSSNGSLTVRSSYSPIALNGAAAPQLEASTSGAYVYSINYSGIEVFSANPATGALAYQGALTTGGGDGNDCARFFSVGLSSYLYLGYGSGFRIINVTTATAPAIVGLPWSTQSPVADIQISAGRAYLSTHGSGLLIYDVSSPLAPAAAGSFHVVPSGVSSAVYGNDLYLALGDPMHGFKTLDVSIPRLLYKLAAPGSSGLISLAATDRYAYAGNGSTLDIYDISSGTWPSYSTTVNLSSRGGTGGIAVSGNLLITGSSSVSVYDITNPLSPTFLASLPVPNYVEDVRICGSLVFVACRDFGLKIIDISTPASPKEMGSLSLSNPSYSLAPVGSYVLVTHGYTKMAVVDVSDPLAPRLVNDYTVNYYGPGGSLNWGNHVEVASNYAYLAEGSGGLVILDISNPASPVDKGHVAPPATLQDYDSVAVQGEYAFVTRENSQLSLINISDPANPVLVSSLGPVAGNEYPKQLVVSGNKVIAVSTGSGNFGGVIGYVTQ